MELSQFQETVKKELKDCREAIKIADPTEWTMREHSLEQCLGWLPRINELESLAMQFLHNLQVSISGLSIPQSQKDFKIKISEEKLIYDELVRATSSLKAQMSSLQSLRKTGGGSSIY
jgi:hypothetical protein